MAPPAEMEEDGLLEVRCAGCGDTLEVERGLTEFACTGCATPQALPPELMPPPPPPPPPPPQRPRRALPLGGPARVPCEGCSAVLAVPRGLRRVACPLCGADLDIASSSGRLATHSGVEVISPPGAAAVAATSSRSPEGDGLDLTPIGKLFQLRYLCIKSYHKHNSDIQLPRQICGQKHLETLVIDGQLSLLPQDIVHLPALSYLMVSVSIAYPDGISNMKSLRTLGNFDPSKQSLDNLRSLGELQNLRDVDISIVDYSFTTKETHKDALLSSIEKLINCNLRHLTAMTLDRTDYYDGWNTLCLSGSHLEQLHLWFPFPRLPGWIGKLSTLSSLEVHVDELCKDDIDVLAGLPALVRLVLFARHLPDEGIVFCRPFRTLDYFESPRADLTFQAGALPKVKTLRLQLDVHEVKMCGIRLNGIEHLPNLKKVAIGLGYSASGESDIPIVEAAIRCFFDEHPARPTIHITNYLYLYDD